MTVTVAAEGGTARLLLVRNSDGASVQAKLSGAHDRLAALKRSLPYSLDQVRKAIGFGTRALNAQEQTVAASRLNDLAYDWLDSVLGGDLQAGPFIRRVATLVAPLLARKSEAGERPLIELVTSDGSDTAWLLPLDILPLPIGRGRELLRYLGMHFAVVRRRSTGSPAPPAGIAIPTKVFAYRKGDYDGITSQVSWFADQPSRFAPLKLWPDRAVQTEERAIQDLAGHLLGALTYGAASRSRAGDGPSILHFCCHYRLAGSDPSGGFSPVAELGFDDDLNVAVHELNGRMARIGRAGPARADNVLLFLNACQSLDRTGFGEGLVEKLLKRGFSNIVGTETLVPDQPAAAFALKFYGFMLQGFSLGSAIVEARRAMVASAGNPIGLLYSVYGDSNLRLA